MRALAILTLLLCACAPANSLDGSARDVFDLAFTEVRALRSAAALALSYERAGSVGPETVISVSVDLALPGASAALVPGGRLALSTEGGVRRAVVTRAVESDVRRILPDIARGQLGFESFSDVAGAEISGDFFITFADGDPQLGAGRTLNGRFSTRLEAR